MKQIKQRPTGTSAAIAGLLVVVATKLGLELTAEEAATIVAGIAAVVSIFTPR